MNKNLKIEISLLLISLIMFFLLIKNIFSSVLYLNLTLLISIYFFPTKVILHRKDKNALLILLSSFLIAVTLILSYVSFILENINDSLKLILLINTLLNLFMIYKLVNLKNKLYGLHLILLFIITMAFYK